MSKVRSSFVENLALLQSSPNLPSFSGNKKNQGSGICSPQKICQMENTKPLDGGEFLPDLQMDPLPEPLAKRKLYLPGLNPSTTHRELFAHFCKFGDLDCVNLKSGRENCNYALIIFKKGGCLERAINANPHKLNGQSLYCARATETGYQRGKDRSRVNRNNFSRTKPVKRIFKQAPIHNNNDNPRPLPRRSERLQIKEALKKIKERENAAKKQDQTFVYSAPKKGRDTRWTMKLTRAFLSQEEQEAFEEEPAESAQVLQDLRAHEVVMEVENLEPEEPLEKSPSPTPSKQTTPEVPELPESVRRFRAVISDSFGDNYNFQLHCYSNVADYKKSRIYIKIESDEMKKRLTIKEFVDKKNEGQITKGWTEVNLEI